MADSDPKSKLSTLLGDGGINRIRRIFPDDAQASVERPLWDSVAQEPARLAGTKIRVYSLRRAKNHHPLYREPSAGAGEWAFHGPWEMWGSIELPQGDAIQTTAQSEGQKRIVESTLWLARKELEDAGAPDPKADDVIEFWDLKPFAGVTPFRFWDVVSANPDGNIMQSETFVQWKIVMRSRTDFNPVRKVET